MSTTPEQKTYTFHVSGMHCKACTVLIEDAAGEIPHVTRAQANLRHNTLTVVGAFDASEEELRESLAAPLRAHGYTLSSEVPTRAKGARDFTLALPIAFLILALFVLLQKTGLVHLVGSGELGYSAIFLIGIIASLSSCMAVVGGLVLSLSATFAKGGDAIRPQTLFHLSRLVAFFVLGGVIGSLGTAFTLTTSATFILNLAIGIVMLILGVNLLDVFARARGFSFTLPSFFSRHVKAIATANHTLTPALAGIATFFLPCGFTQSMQLYTLSTGGFVPGALTMFVFALGTLPVLALMSYSSLSISKGAYAGVFYKTAGLIVIAFALMNILNSFVIIGLIPPFLNF